MRVLHISIQGVLPFNHSCIASGMPSSKDAIGEPDPARDFDTCYKTISKRFPDLTGELRFAVITTFN